MTFADEASAIRAGAVIGDLAERVQLDRQVVRLYRAGAAGVVPAVVTRLEADGLRPQALTLSRSTLDDAFLRVTGERYTDDAAA